MAPHLVLCIDLTEGDESVIMSGIKIVFNLRLGTTLPCTCAFVWRWNGIVVRWGIEVRQYESDG